jgi:protein lysine acetyltransferase
VIRELTRSDRAALAFSFRRLGAQSRFQRFLGAKPELSARELHYLTNVDHWHHDALIAFSPVPRTPIGVCRYIRGDGFDVADIAVEVSDAWQRRGIGRALLHALRERALAAGIRRFTATALAENQAALKLARELGSCTVTHPTGGAVELDIELCWESTRLCVLGDVRSHRPFIVSGRQPTARLRG